MKPLDTQLSPSAPRGQERAVMLRRRELLSTLLSLDVPRNPENFVLLLDADLKRELRFVMTRLKLLFKMLLRKNVLLNLKEPANMSPSLFPSWNLLKSVLMYPRRSGPDPSPTPERSRSLLSRNGATCLLKNLVLPKLMYSS